MNPNTLMSASVFEVVCMLKRKKRKKKMIVYKGNGDMVHTEKQQTDEITISLEKYFRKVIKVLPKNILLAA